MTIIELIKTDIKASGGFGRTIILSASYRIANGLHRSKLPFARVTLFFFKIYYRTIVNLVFGFDVDYRAVIGEGMAVYHGQCIVIGRDVVIGKGVKLRHCTTIGNKGVTGSSSPVIGDNVNIGSNAVVIGGISIGDNAIIGSGSVVVKDVSAKAVVVGYSAREIQRDI